MLDKVVTLRISGAAAPKMNSQATPEALDQATPQAIDQTAPQALDQPAPQQSGKVAVRVVARAPERRCQLKLWDTHGRSPIALVPCDFQKRDENTWDLDESPNDLDGRTLTWSARFFAPRADRFELIVEVLQDGTAVVGGVFVYSGPLEPSEVEERDGRFHFKVERPLSSI